MLTQCSCLPNLPVDVFITHSYQCSVAAIAKCYYNYYWADGILVTAAILMNRRGSIMGGTSDPTHASNLMTLLAMVPASAAISEC